MRVPIIYYKVNRSVGPHRPHNYLEVLMPRHDKNPLDPLLRFPRFKSTDLHMTQKQVWNEVVFPGLEAAFDRLEDRTEAMVRDEVARELARRDNMGQHPSNGEGADKLSGGQGDDALDRELLDAVPVRVNGGQVFHVDRKTGKRIAPEDEARALREDAAALQATRDLLTGENEQLKSWMDDQSDDVRRAVLRALQVEQLKAAHPSNGDEL